MKNGKRLKYTNFMTFNINYLFVIIIKTFMNKCKNIDKIYNDELNIIYEFLRNKNECKKKNKEKQEKHLTYPYVNKLIDNSNNLTEHKINGLACVVKNIFEQKDTIISGINDTIENLNTTLANQGQAISTINTTLTNQGQDISNINTTLANQGQAISTINTTLINQGQDISTINTTLTNQGQDISNINTTLANQGQDISNINTSLANQGQDISDIKNTIINIQNEMNTESSSSDEHSAIQDQDIKDLQNDVGHLKAFIKLTFNYDI
uniref:Uncharacterized protein n=1 Tax=viral metagenome TaxID=1070528 RepID=A0A6C0DXZ0_9ZZZZ